MPADWKNYRPTFGEYGMMFAQVAASRSKNNDKVGCAIFDIAQELVATGYSGPLKGAYDERILALQDRELRSVLMVHAEINALRQVDQRTRLNDAIVFVTSMPCKTCMLHLAASGVRHVVYGNGHTSMMEDANECRLTAAVAREHDIKLDYLPDVNIFFLEDTNASHEV